MKVYNDITMVGGRIRGLSSAIFGDEPVRKADTNVAGAKRVQEILSASGVVSCNWALYDEIRIVTIAAVTLSFSGALDGQGCILTLKGGNGVTLPVGVRYNSQVNFYVPTAGATAIDKLGFVFDNGDTKYDLVSAVMAIS